MAVLDAEVPVMHRVWVPNATPGRHGSAEEGTLADPVPRLAFQVYPMRWQTMHPDQHDTEDAALTTTDMLMDVPDPTVYKKRDSVVVQGLSYVVQGLPEDWGGGQIMSEYDSMFGGTVHIRRVSD